MNILFITLVDIRSIKTRNIYTDLLRQFQSHGHKVFVVSPTERRNRERTFVIKEDGCTILKVKTGNIQKTRFVEKGISTLLVSSQMIKAIKKNYGKIKFNLILYSTPPITFADVIEYVKNRDDAKTYLLLKDIWPDSMADLGVLRKTGITGVIYRYFRKKEKSLYDLSDRIGCLSQANIDYVLRHNDVPPYKLEICPNSIEPVDISMECEKKIETRRKLALPEDKKILIYGGNLGMPQGIPFFLRCIDSQKDNNEIFFLIVGSGTEYGKIKNYIKDKKIKNVKLISSLPKDEYDRVVGSCDVGLVFLDARYKIPNYPSRMLSYMEAKLPVLAATDTSTDLGKDIVDGGFGWWCESKEVDDFHRAIQQMLEADLQKMSRRSWDYLQKYFTVVRSYNTIMKMNE